MARNRAATILAWMLSKIILAVLAVIVLAIVYLKLTAVRISGSEARTLVADGAILVDVRSRAEYKDGGIEGSINIPIQELSARVDELGNEGAKIVVYCQSGARSAMAKRLLERRGFTEVHDLGSKGRW